MVPSAVPKMIEVPSGPRTRLLVGRAQAARHPMRGRDSPDHGRSEEILGDLCIEILGDRELSPRLEQTVQFGEAHDRIGAVELAQRAAVAEKVARGVVLADAAYGINTEFRDGITDPLLRGSWVNQVRKACENARKPA
jgi:hypothetical protein